MRTCFDSESAAECSVPTVTALPIDRAEINSFMRSNIFPCIFKEQDDFNDTERRERGEEVRCLACFAANKYIQKYISHARRHCHCPWRCRVDSTLKSFDAQLHRAQSVVSSALSWGFRLFRYAEGRCFGNRWWGTWGQWCAIDLSLLFHSQNLSPAAGRMNTIGRTSLTTNTQLSIHIFVTMRDRHA